MGSRTLRSLTAGAELLFALAQAAALYFLVRGLTTLGRPIPIAIQFQNWFLIGAAVAVAIAMWYPPRLVWVAALCMATFWIANDIRMLLALSRVEGPLAVPEFWIAIVATRAGSQLAVLASASTVLIGAWRGRVAEVVA